MVFSIHLKFFLNFKVYSLYVGSNVILSPLLSHAKEAVEALHCILW